MNIRIGPLAFDHADYDAEGDVLYLHVGEPVEGAREETPEGHVVRFESGSQRVVGLTVMAPRRILDRDGRLTATIPGTVEASGEDLAPAMAPACSARAAQLGAVCPVCGPLLRAPESNSGQLRRSGSGPARRTRTALLST